LSGDPVPLGAWLRDAAARLAPTSPTARLDAELIAAHALGLPREAMLLRLRDLAVPAAADALVERRLRGEPVAYLTGRRAFWTIELAVGPGVLIPRPDSETLIEAAVAHFADRAPRRILDLGTGSGALLLAALDQWPQASGIGIDRSQAALGMARGNAERLGMAARADIRAGDWAKGLDERFDLVLCNPPYIAAGTPLDAEVVNHEPAGALFAGADGLDAHRILAPQLGRLIAPGGMAAVEIGHDQGQSAAALFRAAGLAVRCRTDLAGRDRCLHIQGVDGRGQR
jgi:release factor glutamine methyltransferase